MSHRIVFLDRATIAPQIRVRPPSFAHELIEHAHTHPEQVVERLAGASIVITNKVPITDVALAQLPALKLVAVAATGTDCVDKAACAARGVAVSNIRGYAVNTVPEHTFALILALRRNIVAYRESVLAGRWQESGQFCFFDHPIRDLRGARLGIIGEGVLGQRVAEIARVFGMQPLFAAHKGSSGLGPLYTPWQEMLETSDVITLHSPLTQQTRGMIAMPEFEAMTRRPLIINTARGALVDSAALAAALRAVRLGGAAIDVLPQEPPVDGNPLLAGDIPNLIVTPHIAWAALESRQRCLDDMAANVEDFRRGGRRGRVV